MPDTPSRPTRSPILSAAGALLSRRALLTRSGAVLAATGIGAARAPAAAFTTDPDGDDVVAFYVISDTHYLAHADAPDQLEPSSVACTGRLIERLNTLPGTEIPARSGGGVVRPAAAVLHAGDVIDTGDKAGMVQSRMQETEIAAFEKTMGLTGRDGALDFPIYEVHGNHDGPAGKGPAIERIRARNRSRPGVTHVSPNGLHCSWDVGPVHFVNLGIVVGAVPGVGRRRRYAPLDSLDFLVRDLAEHVGASGRPVVITHHIDIARYTAPVADDAPYADKEWDPADVGAFHAALAGFNVAAIFHGHTHGRAVWRWNGRATAPGPEQLPDEPPAPAAEGTADAAKADTAVYDVFNADNAATPHGGQQAFFYVEIGPAGLTVREYGTKDAWQSGSWSPLVWRRPPAPVAATSARRVGTRLRLG
jgi:hypothetical protein